MINDLYSSIIFRYLDNSSEQIRLIKATNLQLKNYNLSIELSQNDICHMYFLQGIREIDFGDNHVTDDMLEYIRGAKKVSLDALNITDNGLKNLKGIKEITLNNPQKITEKGYYFLRGVEKINIFGPISFEEFENIKNAKEIYISGPCDLPENARKMLINNKKKCCFEKKQ